MAARTQRIRLGTLLTPLPWRRPWKVASQVATVDQLSGGRAILSVGVGALDTGLPYTGEETDKRLRAERLDEGIDLIRTLWDGRLSYHGDFYDFECDRDDLIGAVRPVSGRIPIWVVGVWPRPKSMRRVLRCDGVIPQYNVGGSEPTPDDARAVRAWLAEHGARPGHGRRGRDTARGPGGGVRAGRPLGGGRLHLVAGDTVGDAARQRRAHGRDPRPAGRRATTPGNWAVTRRVTPAT